MTAKLKWGLIGTGNIARKFAEGLAESRTGQLIAIGSRTAAAAQKFAQEFPAATHASYEALLADQNVEAVYISTPHPMHAEWAIKSAEAGKHILCEKPATLNFADTMAVLEAVRANDVFFMEAFMYRCHPQTAKIVELIREQALGAVRLIQATFSFCAAFNPESRLLAQSLGGGGVLDVGCYTTSFARLVAGAVDGIPFAEPVEVKGLAQLGESRVDEFAIANLKFANGIVAQLASGVRLGLANDAHIWGDEGHLEIPSPWIVTRGAGEAKMIFHKNGAEPEEIVTTSDRSLYALEADNVAAHLAERQSPAMPWADTLGNIQTLDRWRVEIGLVYDSENPETRTETITRRPLAPRPGHHMQFGRIDGVDKPVSRLILGVDNQATYPIAAVMFDDFIERGGNCFDTAHIYGDGVFERRLGHWMKNRRNRSEVVLIGKGAHTPWCNPADLTSQLFESLERLQTDHLDIYIMHRDNPGIPVGEFVDVLNEHQRAGRIRVFGGSNWGLDRIDAANAYAQEHGLAGFSLVSNNFSLARMIHPPWAGCISASDPASRAWFEKKQLPLLAWSSQARGFFTERAGKDKLDDAELVRCWYSDDNFRRRERALDLAKKKNVLPINIALAYVLAQPFPTFALIGPRMIEETRTTMPALDLELTPEEIRWLNLET